MPRTLPVRNLYRALSNRAREYYAVVEPANFYGGIVAELYGRLISKAKWRRPQAKFVTS